MARPILLIAFASGLFGATRALASFLELFTRQDSGEGLLPALARNLSIGEMLWPVLGWAALGVGGSVALAVGISRVSGLGREAVLSELSRPFVTLVVPAGLVVAAALSLLLAPAYPYGVNLAVTLALEGAFAELLAMLLFGAVLGHTLVRIFGSVERRVPGLVVVLTTMVLFTLATPARFYDEGVGQGNMFKYVRMAATIGGTGTLNIERAEENPNPTLFALVRYAPQWVGNYVRAIGDLIAGSEPEAEATKVNRSMFRSVDGGVYYINAPGPGVLLVPAYLLDQTLNQMFGWDKQIVVIVFWQLLGALLVYEIVLSVSAVAERSAGIGAGFAVGMTVPFLFYTFQIYPELPGGLLLLFAFRRLVLDPTPGGRAVLAAAVALAALPWLHQKYSVVSAVLGLWAAAKLMRRTAGGVSHHPYKLVLLAAPLAVSAFSIFLYNHALTGSLSPTATFSAAERSSFEPWNFFKGFSGLLLDRENGLFVFAPVYVLALVGAQAFFLRHRRFVFPLVLVLASYLIVIASFPYWPGAVSTMGRYILSILPLLALPMALVVERAFSDGLLAGAGMTLVSASLAYSVSFVRDLIPSYQPPLFWSRALYSDPAQYLPSFLSDGFLGSGPAHFVKFLVWILIIGLVVLYCRERVYDVPFSVEAESDGYHRRACSGAGLLIVGILGSALVLERWPGNDSDKRGPTFPETLELADGRVLWVFGEHGFEGSGVWVPGGGATDFLLRSSRSLNELTIRVSTDPQHANTVEFRERGDRAVALELPPGGPHERTVLLRKPLRFDGPRGESYLYRFTVHSVGSFVPAGEDARSLGAFVRVR